MAKRDLIKNSVLTARIQEIKVLNTGSECLWIGNLKGGSVNVVEEIKRETYECQDSTEIITDKGRKVVADLTYDEISGSDISKITGGDYFAVATNTGGISGSGIVFEISGSDTFVDGFIDGTKTHVHCERATTGALPYRIGHVSGATWVFGAQ